MNPTLFFSPLQGLTDFRFRNAFNKYFSGIESFYAPFIRLNHKRAIKPAYERDLLPENNRGINLIPQILTRDADEFLYAADYIQRLGYQELNWNLGCPYPMVAKRGLGCGLLKDPAAIKSILERVHAESGIGVSIKMRLGYESSDEIFKVLPVLERYPLKNIVLHPRIGKQLYSGEVDLDAFQRCVQNTNHTVCFNGDIRSFETFNAMVKRFPMTDHWMIGRGIIANPFLPSMIHANTSEYPENRLKVFSQFHDTLFHDYAQALSGASHVIMKMLQFWEYFIEAFPDSHKEFKKIKKAKSITAYEKAVEGLLNRAGNQ